MYISVLCQLFLTENLADELELAHQTHCSVPVSKTKIISDADVENRKRERIESFTAEAQCDDHPPIIGTQGINKF